MGIARSLLVVEDQPLYRELLTGALHDAGFIVHACGDALTAVELWETHDPDGAVLDINLGSAANGLALAERIRLRSPVAAIVFLTSVIEPRLFAPGRLPIGSTYVDKTRIEGVHELVAAIDHALKGAAPRARHDTERADVLRAMTTPQLEVLSLMAQGLPNDEIARVRGTSVRAVERLVSRALGRVEDVTEPRRNARVVASVAIAKAASDR